MYAHSYSLVFFFSSRRRHTRWPRDWSSDVCSSDLPVRQGHRGDPAQRHGLGGGRGGGDVVGGHVIDVRHHQPRGGQGERGQVPAHLPCVESRLGVHEVGPHLLPGERDVEHALDEHRVVPGLHQVGVQLVLQVCPHVTTVHCSILTPHGPGRTRRPLSARQGGEISTTAARIAAPLRPTRTGLSRTSRTSGRSSVSTETRATTFSRARVSWTGRPRWPNSRGAALGARTIWATSTSVSGGTR